MKSGKSTGGSKSSGTNQGGKSTSAPSRGAGWPAKTGNPSGKGRCNAPSKK